MSEFLQPENAEAQLAPIGDDRSLSDFDGSNGNASVSVEGGPSGQAVPAPAGEEYDDEDEDEDEDDLSGSSEEDSLSDLSDGDDYDDDTDPFGGDAHLLDSFAIDESGEQVKVLSLDEVPFDRDIRYVNVARDASRPRQLVEYGPSKSASRVMLRQMQKITGGNKAELEMLDGHYKQLDKLKRDYDKRAGGRGGGGRTARPGDVVVTQLKGREKDRERERKKKKREERDQRRAARYASEAAEDAQRGQPGLSRRERRVRAAIAAGDSNGNTNSVGNGNRVLLAPDLSLAGSGRHLGGMGAHAADAGAVPLATGLSSPAQQRKLFNPNTGNVTTVRQHDRDSRDRGSGRERESNRGRDRDGYMGRGGGGGGLRQQADELQEEQQIFLASQQHRRGGHRDRDGPPASYNANPRNQPTSGPPSQNHRLGGQHQHQHHSQKSQLHLQSQYGYEYSGEYGYDYSYETQYGYSHGYDPRYDPTFGQSYDQGYDPRFDQTPTQIPRQRNGSDQKTAKHASSTRLDHSRDHAGDVHASGGTLKPPVLVAASGLRVDAPEFKPPGCA